jgi:Phosphodiester glycosidase
MPDSQLATGPCQQIPLRRRLCRLAARFVCLFAVVGLAVAAYQWWTRPRPIRPTEVCRGVTYACLDLRTPECRGLVHVVKVDLSAPGVQVYLTPLDQDAVAQGWQYRLATAASVLERERLAVVVNATFFSSDSGWIQWSGDLARGVQTIVADGQVSHVDPNSYLLWFESDLTPHLEFTKPPSKDVLRQARWGVGGGAVSLWKGAVREGVASHEMDRRTAVGIDTGRRMLWLAAFENASPAAVARFLAEQGAQDGFLLDGGHSTTMVLGPQAAHVQAGELIHGWRPAATFFGIRAEPLR